MSEEKEDESLMGAMRLGAQMFDAMNSLDPEALDKTIVVMAEIAERVSGAPAGTVLGNPVKLRAFAMWFRSATETMALRFEKMADRAEHPEPLN